MQALHISMESMVEAGMGGIEEEEIEERGNAAPAWPSRIFMAGMMIHQAKALSAKTNAEILKPTMQPTPRRAGRRIRPVSD